MLSLLSVMLCCVAVSAQHKVEMIPSEIWINGLTARLKNRELSAVLPKCMLSDLRQLSVKTSRIRIWAVPVGYFQRDGACGRHHQNQYFGISGEARATASVPVWTPVWKA